MLEDAPEPAPDTHTLLLQLQEQLGNAPGIPLSATARVHRDEFGELIQRAVDALPGELREARFVLKERDEVLERARNEADRIIEAARVRAERMVERTETVREARRTADAIIEQAKQEGARIRHEAEDYVDRKLAAFEVVLDRTLQQVQNGRERLQVHVEPAALEEEALEEGSDFFDQDE